MGRAQKILTIDPFLPPPLPAATARACKRFLPPPPPNDAFIIKLYSHPPLCVLLACLLLAPLAVEETITFNVQVEVIPGVITSMENTTRQLKRVFVQLADTQKKKVEWVGGGKAKQRKEKKKTVPSCSCGVLDWAKCRRSYIATVR